jgi:hypothetical protein
VASHSFFDDENQYDWNPGAEHLLDSMPRYTEFMQDETAQWLLDTAFFNDEVSRSDRGVARAWVEEYWITQYGYIFHDQFDWAGWRSLISP